jgi:hypothetical protein
MPEFNNIQDELEHAREQQRLNIPAKRILEKIQGIPSDVGFGNCYKMHPITMTK